MALITLKQVRVQHRDDSLPPESRPNLWLIILALLGVTGTFIYAAFLVGPNTPFYAQLTYRINRRQLEETAAAYGLSVPDISDYGLDPFPINYITSTLAWDNDPDYRTQTVYREDVEAVVRGAQSRRDGTRTLFEQTARLWYNDTQARMSTRASRTKSRARRRTLTHKENTHESEIKTRPGLGKTGR